MSFYLCHQLRHCRELACRGMSILVALSAVLLAFTPNSFGQAAGKLRSPQLAALDAQISAGNLQAVEEFWANMKGKTPLIEPIEGDELHVLVTFLWRGDEDTRNVQIVGGRPGPRGHERLKQLRKTAVWYITQTMHVASRGSYGFRVNIPMTDAVDFDEDLASFTEIPPQPDPENPQRSLMFSIFELAKAPPQPWIKVDPQVAKGKTTQHKLKSEILGQERSFMVYKPAAMKRDAVNNLLVFFDAEFYGAPMLVPTSTILDNLIAAGKIGPTAAVFINNLPHQRSRYRDLKLSEPFARFVATELVPWVRDRYQVTSDPSRTAVCGVSLGGAAAVFCGLKHPDVFGNVLSQSGSFALEPNRPIHDFLPYDAPTNWLAREFATSERLPLRFYLEVGLFERFATSYGADMVLEQRRLRDVLKAKGHPVIDSEYYGGHDYICHRGSLADGLIALLSHLSLKGDLKMMDTQPTSH